MRIIIAFIFTCTVAGHLFLSCGGKEDTKDLQAPLFDNLGDYQVEISITLVQHLLNRDINLTYGFNYREAAKAFLEATRLDPSCAIRQWDIAYQNIRQNPYFSSFMAEIPPVSLCGPVVSK
ncbi:hypothetical protein [Negadavirga shengliensis]|uniref:Tetratricopeptide repeat protein n=1 Tax=Negadavirga shengliensis TaxID=1389218 RepID=A0ABV9T7V0_9BACT